MHISQYQAYSFLCVNICKTSSDQAHSFFNSESSTFILQLRIKHIHFSSTFILQLRNKHIHFSSTFIFQAHSFFNSESSAFISHHKA